jgi:hypothetical protein
VRKELIGISISNQLMANVCLNSGDNNIINSSAVVITDIKESGFYVGNPVRKIR